jgi:hypothetical protein
MEDLSVYIYFHRSWRREASFNSLIARTPFGIARFKKYFVFRLHCYLILVVPCLNLATASKLGSLT